MYGVVLNSPFGSSLTSTRARSGITGGQEVKSFLSWLTNSSFFIKLNFSASVDKSSSGFLELLQSRLLSVYDGSKPCLDDKFIEEVSLISKLAL